VQLINEPPSELIQAEKQELPAPLTDVTVQFKQPIKRAWVAAPSPNSPAS